MGFQGQKHSLIRPFQRVSQTVQNVKEPSWMCLKPCHMSDHKVFWAFLLLTLCPIPKPRVRAHHVSAWVPPHPPIPQNQTPHHEVCAPEGGIGRFPVFWITRGGGRAICSCTKTAMFPIVKHRMNYCPKSKLYWLDEKCREISCYREAGWGIIVESKEKFNNFSIDSTVMWLRK